MHTNECEFFKNNYLKLYTNFNDIIAKIFLRVSLWLLIVDFGNYHEMFLLVEFIFFEDKMGLGASLLVIGFQNMRYDLW